MKFTYTLRMLNRLLGNNETLRAKGDARGAERVIELKAAIEVLKNPSTPKKEDVEADGIVFCGECGHTK